MRTALALLLLAATTAFATPNEITAEYDLTNFGIKIGRVKESFVRSGDRYTLRSVTRSEGPLKMLLDDQLTLESRGLIVAGRLQPLQFGQSRIKDPSRDVSATFDWERGVIHSSYKGEKKELPLPPNTQDRISFLYQFMNVAPRQGTVVAPMSNGRKVDHYTYRFVDQVRVSTPAGDFETFHFERVLSGPKDGRVEVWLAKDRFNFPVRVVFHDPKGFRLEQSLVALQSR